MNVKHGLEWFRVENLHGRRTINLRVRDNRLVIVGENGAGKSTIANLVYYFLTRQWRRIGEYRFDSIEMAVGGETFRFSNEEINAFRGPADEGLKFLPPPVRRVLRHLDSAEVAALLANPDSFERTLRHSGVPARYIREMVLQHPEEIKAFSEARGIEGRISELVGGQVLYLPTYRRIEQDLASIFRGMEEDVRQFRERLTSGRKRTSYIELVEFGMEDVEKSLAARMGSIKENVRTGLSNLMGTYLRDVIRGEHLAVKAERLEELDQQTLDSMFARIEEGILSTTDKERLRMKVVEILGKSQISDEERVVAHFLSRLTDLYKRQRESEKDVRSFVQVCNEYLVGKELVYDDVNYNIFVREAGGGASGEGPGRLELKLLSSGEKQIVSLFSHIYLSGQRSFFVIIDEPELSLSVPWQRRFLPDILGTGRCVGLLAVTHSPFIWDNELEPYVHSLSEFVETIDVVR